MKVFLGGTCAGSTWRDELIPQLKIDYFNPVVADWTPECRAEEIRQKPRLLAVFPVGAVLEIQSNPASGAGRKHSRSLYQQDAPCVRPDWYSERFRFLLSFLR